MIQPFTFTIGDDWIIRAKNVTSGRTKLLIPDATVKADIVDKLDRRIVMPTTDLTLVNAETATFEGIALAAAIANPVNNTLYSLNLDILHGGVRTEVTTDIRALLDNPHSPFVNISVPGKFTIDQDLPFRALFVKDETGNTHIGDVLYELLDRLTREVKAAGPMSLYDPANGHYEAVIDKSLLTSDEIGLNNDYVLHVIIQAYLDTTVSAFLSASNDAIANL